MKILVVDDSALYRTIISKALLESKFNLEITTANNGNIALDYLKMSKFDLITLDLEMPEMDGIETLKQLNLQQIQTKVIVFSAISTFGAEKTMEALKLGALDFATKIVNTSGQEDSFQQIKETLLPKVESLLNLRKLDPTIINRRPINTDKKPIEMVRSDELLSRLTNFYPKVICIGSSTGGPAALREVLSLIKGDLGLPVLITQHMPKFFTKKLAEDLDRICELNVKEAENGETIKKNTAYIAPGDYHMEIVGNPDEAKIKLNQNEKVCFVRPSVDVMLWSVGKVYKRNILNIILTGMGQDGLDGCLSLKENGCPVYIQDESTSVVWGMPGAIAAANIQEQVLPINRMSELINLYQRIH